MTKHELCIMDHTGDTKTLWDPNSPDEVAAARRTFSDMKAKGYIAYRVAETGKKAEIMGVFDPEAGKVILAPPMRGG
jgi:hypothetical protein